MERGRAGSLLAPVLAPGKRVLGLGGSSVPRAGTRCHEGELSRGARCPSPALAVPDVSPGCGAMAPSDRGAGMRCSQHSAGHASASAQVERRGSRGKTESKV